MSSSHDAFRILLAALATISLFAGCATAGNGGAGSAGVVKGDVREINQRTQAVFKEMNIQMVSSDTVDYGRNQSIGGKSGDEDIAVHMIATSDNTTRVEVSARAGAIGWDKDFSNEILSKIVQG